MRFEGLQPRPEFHFTDGSLGCQTFTFQNPAIRIDGILYVKGKQVKLLKQSSISCTSKNTRGQRGDYKGTTNANPVNDYSNKNIKP